MSAQSQQLGAVIPHSPPLKLPKPTLESSSKGFRVWRHAVLEESLDIPGLIFIQLE